MDTNLVMKTKLRGGLGRFITGESIFINEFTAQGGPGEIGIAPGAPGDLRHVYLQEQTMYLQNSAYVASGNGVAVESKWQGLMKGFFSGESLFLIRCQGKGDLWFSSYGGIIEIDVTDEYVVHHALQSTDNVCEHRGPRDFPNRGIQWSFNDRAIVTRLTGGFSRRLCGCNRWCGIRHKMLFR